MLYVITRDVQASKKQMRKLLSGDCFMCLASGAMAPWTGSGMKTLHPIGLGAAHMMKTTSCVEKGINKVVLSNLIHCQNLFDASSNECAK